MGTYDAVRSSLMKYVIIHPLVLQAHGLASQNSVQDVREGQGFRLCCVSMEWYVCDLSIYNWQMPSMFGSICHGLV